MSETERCVVSPALVAEIRAMRPSTDVYRLMLSRKHREDEIGKIAYRRAINDVLERLAAPAPAGDSGGERGVPPAAADNVGRAGQ